MKKALSLSLCIVMLISLLPVYSVASPRQKDAYQDGIVRLYSEANRWGMEVLVDDTVVKVTLADNKKVFIERYAAAGDYDVGLQKNFTGQLRVLSVHLCDFVFIRDIIAATIDQTGLTLYRCSCGEEQEVITPVLEPQEPTDKPDYLKGVYSTGVSPDNKILRELGAEWLRERAVYPFEDNGVALTPEMLADATLSKGYLEAKAKIINNKSNGFNSYVQGIQIGAPRYNAETQKNYFLSGIPEQYGTFKEESYYAAVEMIYEFQARDLKDYVTYWQVSNEPDHGLFIDLAGGMGTAHVIKFLQAAARGIHRGNPDALVGTNLATENDIAKAIMDELSKDTADGSHFDWIGIDGYFGTLSAGGAESWKPLLDRMYDRTGLPIIVVEWGFSSTYETAEPGRAGNPIPGKTYSSDICKNKRWTNTWNGQQHSPALQAEFIQECMKVFMEHPAVIGSFYFFYSDGVDGHICQLCGEPNCPFDCAWGLVDGTFSQPKPSYYALQEIYGGGELDIPASYPSRTGIHIVSAKTNTVYVRSGSAPVNEPINSKITGDLTANVWLTMYNQSGTNYPSADTATGTTTWTIRNYTDGAISIDGGWVTNADKPLTIAAGNTSVPIGSVLNGNRTQTAIGLTVTEGSKGKITISAVTEADGYTLPGQPQSLFDGAPLNAIGSTGASNGGKLNFGNLFELKRDGTISALKYYNGDACYGEITMRLYKLTVAPGGDPLYVTTGDMILELTPYTANGQEGWVTFELTTPLQVEAGYYIVSATSGADSEGKSRYAEADGTSLPKGDSNISFIFGRHTYSQANPAADSRGSFPGTNWSGKAAMTDVVFTRDTED